MASNTKSRIPEVAASLSVILPQLGSGDPEPWPQVFDGV
jgi:hypothetical protein